MTDVLKWLEKWYKSQCNGDWEHEYGIKVYTLDNPGWAVAIDLKNTKFEDLNIKYTLLEKAKDDWIGFSVKDGIFNGAGDCSKLKQIIMKFKEIIEKNNG